MSTSLVTIKLPPEESQFHEAPQRSHQFAHRIVQAGESNTAPVRFSLDEGLSKFRCL
jgi:hypothetical protein